tara:strand:- start:18517 stop:19038 length:522 start_codon:yes stop_codon:yes gene_type:complete
MTYLARTEKLQNYVHNVDTSFATEGAPWTAASNSKIITTTVELYQGTEVTYTPAAGASKVVYECDFQAQHTPDGGKSHMNTRLQYSDDNGSSWNDINGCKIYLGTELSSGTVDYDWLVFNLSFIIDTWSGERKLRLAGRSDTTNDEYIIGRSYNANQSEGPGSCPHVSIYSIV